MTQQNGRTTWWVMGLIAALIVVSITSWLGFVYANIEDLHGQDMKVEGRMSKVEECMSSTKERLTRIERKIDIMMNRNMGVTNHG